MSSKQPFFQYYLSHRQKEGGVLIKSFFVYTFKLSMGNRSESAENKPL